MGAYEDAAAGVARVNQVLQERGTTALARVLSIEDRLATALRPGARVRDKVTGQVGVILAGRRENVLVAAP